MHGFIAKTTWKQLVWNETSKIGIGRVSLQSGEVQFSQKNLKTKNVPLFLILWFAPWAGGLESEPQTWKILDLEKFLQVQTPRRLRTVHEKHAENAQNRVRKKYHFESAQSKFFGFARFEPWAVLVILHTSGSVLLLLSRFCALTYRLYFTRRREAALLYSCVW